MRADGDTLDAVIAGVNIVELDPRDNSVGYGGCPTRTASSSLAASCVHGPRGALSAATCGWSKDVGGAARFRRMRRPSGSGCIYEKRGAGAENLDGWEAIPRFKLNPIMERRPRILLVRDFHLGIVARRGCVNGGGDFGQHPPDRPPASYG